MALANCIKTLKDSKDISPWLADDIDQALANRGRLTKKKAIAAYIDNALADMRGELEDIYDDLGIDAKDPLLGHAEESLNSTQAKSASQNKGTYSEGSNDLRLSESRFKPVDTNSPEFKRWFGDSKVVDASGKPLVVYHGTAADFNEFDTMDFGAWFAEKTSTSDDYVTKSMDDDNGDVPKTIPVFIAAKQPFYIPRDADLSSDISVKDFLKAINKANDSTFTAGDFGLDRSRVGNGFEHVSFNDKFFEILKDEGFDSVRAYERGEVTWNVFSPTQIKSSISNTGEFSSTNPDIRYSTPRQQPWYYSALEDGVRAMPAKVSGTSAANVALWLKSNAAKLKIKTEEIEWSGVMDYLDSLGKEKITAEQLADWVSENGVKVEEVVLGEDVSYMWSVYSDSGRHVKSFDNEDAANEFASDESDRYDAEYSVRKQMSDISSENTKHASGKLVLSGGADHREIVLTVPTIEPYAESDSTHYGDTGKGKAIAWARVNTRVDADGRKVLFVEEIQSQRGQHGRKSGFREAVQWRVEEKGGKFYAYDQRGEIFGVDFTREKAIDRANDDYRAISSKPTSAPFVSTKDGKPVDSYIGLTLKRLIAYAVDHGFDAVSWTTGEQQADRYDLSKQISKIQYERNPSDGTYQVRAFDLDGSMAWSKDRANASELSDFLGKDIAEKITAGEGSRVGGIGSDVKALAGLDLKVGGAWTASMYGDANGNNAQGKPSMITAAARKLGAEVGGIDLAEDAPTFRIEGSTREFKSDGARTGMQPGFPITPAMRDQVQSNGMPLFSTSRAAPFDLPTESPARSASTGQQIQNTWLSPAVERLDNIRRVMQDKLVDTRKVVEEIKKTRQVRDDFNPDLQETLYHSRTSERVEDFTEDEVRPLIEEMGKRKITIKELEAYLWAMHAKERNAQIAKINPAMPDGGSGMTNQQATEILAGNSVTINGKDYKIDHNKTLAYRDLGRRIEAITKGTADLLVAEGLETADTVKAWRDTYKHYVPLMRDMESDDNYSGSFGLGTGQGFNTKGSSSKRATGSERTVTDIMANLLTQRERAITRVEKNKVAMAVYGLSMQNPNTDFWVTINPGGDPKDIVSKLQQMGVSAADAQTYADNIANQPATPVVDPKTGAVTYRAQPLLLQRDNVLAVRINGKDRYVMFSSDERAQQMVRNLKSLDDDQLKYGLGAVAKATRYFAAINTQYNPVFGLTNFARDSGTAMLNLSSTPLAGKQRELAGHVASALKGIYIDLRERRAGRHPTSQWAGEFDEFRRNGGVTGYRDLFRTSQDRTDALVRELGNVGKGKWTQFNINHPVMGWLSDYNTAIENAWRVSAYKVAKDSGMSKDQAAALAKNLTVNFNRKGQVTTQAGALYAFFNAAVQGSSRIAETMLTKDANGNVRLSAAGKKIAYGAMVAGAMQAVMFMLAGWDDKEPPQWLREKNFIIPTPWNDKKYVMYPMPLGFHVLLNVGRIPMEFFLGGMKNPGDRMAQMMGVILDGFNPLGSSTPLQMLTPTVADPLAALEGNRDWSGKNIYRDDFNKLKPTAGWTRTKDTATDISKALSYGINYITGGGKYGIGVFSPSPDEIDYVAGQIGGGLYREGAKLYQAGKTVITGEELPEYKRPVAGRFYGSTTGQASEMSRFYDNLKRIGAHASTLDEMKDAGDIQAMQQYRKEHPEAAMVAAADKFQRQLGYLKRQKRDAMDKGQAGRVKMLETQITTMVTNANKYLSPDGRHGNADELED